MLKIFEIFSGLRLDGLPALELWDLIVFLGNVSRVSDRSGKPESDNHKHHKSHNKIDVIKDIDLVPSNVQSARQEALLYVFEDNEAVIKMIIKGRSPTMRHVSRTHRVALDWLFDRINLDSKDPNQIHWHQTPTRRHTDKGKFHTWWMESFFGLDQMTGGAWACGRERITEENKTYVVKLLSQDERPVASKFLWKSVPRHRTKPPGDQHITIILGNNAYHLNCQTSSASNWQEQTSLHPETQLTHNRASQRQRQTEKLKSAEQLYTKLKLSLNIEKL